MSNRIRLALSLGLLLAAATSVAAQELPAPQRPRRPPPPLGARPAERHKGKTKSHPGGPFGATVVTIPQSQTEPNCFDRGSCTYPPGNPPGRPAGPHP